VKHRAIVDDDSSTGLIALNDTPQAAGASRRMRAFHYDGKAVQLSTTYDAPSPMPGEALIRTLRCSISRRDHTAAADGSPFRGVLGHECVGIVEKINGEDTNGLTGKRVVCSINTFCGSCDLCARGLSVHCRQRKLLGLDQLDGCFADTFTMPVFNLVAVPDHVDDDHAIFAQPLANAIQAIRQLTIEGKPYITVLGDGPTALLAAQMMAKLNASVRLIGMNHTRLSLCEKWGIKHRHVDDIGRRADQDIVVDCTGSTQGIALAMQLVRPRGKVLLKSLFLQPNAHQTVDLTPLLLHEIELIGSHIGPVSEAIAVLGQHDVDVVSLISKRSSLDQIERAWSASKHPDIVKIVLEV